MTLANFNSNFNWQLRALQQAAECCGIVPDLPPGPPPSENCWCGIFEYSMYGTELDVKSIIINGGTSVVYSYPNIFDPAWPASFATFLNGLFPDTNVDVSFVQYDINKFRICVKNLDGAFSIDTIELGGGIGTVNMSVSATCTDENKEVLQIVFNDTWEVISYFGFDPSLATAADWNNYLGPAYFTYYSWSPSGLGGTATLYGSVDMLILPAVLFYGFTTLSMFLDYGGYYDVIGFSVFYFNSSLTQVYFSAATFADVEAFSSIYIYCNFDLPSMQALGSNCFTSSYISGINIPSLTYIGGSCFAFAYFTTGTLSAPSCTYVDYSAFLISNITNLYLPLCTNLGGSPFNDNVFDSIAPSGLGTFTFNNVLSTINSGMPDGDIDYVTTTYPGIITVTYV